MKNKTTDLKNHCFLMLEELTNPENNDPEKVKETLAKAKAVASIATTINNTIKNELEAMKMAIDLGHTPDFKPLLGEGVDKP